MSREGREHVEQEPVSAPQRAPSAAPPQAAVLGAPLDTHAVLALQRSAGNCAVSTILRQSAGHRCDGTGECGCELCGSGQQVEDPTSGELVDEHAEDGAHQGVHGQAADELDGGGGGGAVAEAGAVAPGGPDGEQVDPLHPEPAGATEEESAEGERATPEKPPAQRLMRQALASAARKKRMLARAATWSAGPVHQVNNLADCVINGTPAGVTWPTLNGTQFWSGAAAAAAIARPTLTTAAAASGGFESSVTTVGNNTGSFDETVLRAGPWTLNTTRAAVNARVPGLPAACAGAGNTSFQAKGNPSDADMFAANRRHEDHHAADHQAAFNASIAPWDARLTAAKTAGTKFTGATAAAAEAALWTAMGGTPEQVATDFYNRCQAAVIAYHGSAAGGPIGPPTSPGESGGCANSWASYTNPS